MGPKGTECIKQIVESLKNQDYEVRTASLEALGKMGAAGAKYDDQVTNLLDDPMPTVVAAACDCLGHMGQAATPSSVAGARIADLATDKHPVIRAAALRSLGMMGDEAVNYLDIMLKRLNDVVWSVRAAALEGITGCGLLGQMYAADICRATFDSE